MNSLVDEIVSVTAKERVLLEQCKDFLSTLAAIQVNKLFYFIFLAIFCFICSFGSLEIFSIG